MCTSPSVAIKLGVSHNTGKNFIKLYRDTSKSLEYLKSVYGAENVLLLPCGHCSECLLKRRQEWAVRCACESLDHNVSSFITLTYDDAHLRPLNRKDPLKFIKSLRNSGFKVRYFGCGERGEHNLRPHYHIVVFGYLPTDLKYDGDSESGQALYYSKFCEDLWAKGRVVVQIFSPEVAGYVAGYTSKKFGDTDSFQFQSTKPGIGHNYLVKHKDKILKYGQLYGDFGVSKSSSIPRYFKKILENHGYSFVLDILADEKARINEIKTYEKLRLHNLGSLENAITYNRHFADKKIKKLVRSL